LGPGSGWVDAHRVRRVLSGLHMSDITRDIHLFVSVARIESALAVNRAALARLPQEIAAIDKAVGDIDAAEKKAHDDLEDMKKKRRDTERLLHEHEDHLKKTRGQQSLVKSNEAYTAMLKEISNLESSISQEEEQLLMLMDTIESAELLTTTRATDLRAERALRLEQRTKLEGDVARVTADTQRLTAELPKVLAEISPPLVKRYERLVPHREIVVTRVEAEHCGECRQQLPPQLAVEVRKNDQFIMCPACGRILVSYAD
jgi:predicted  nucleic acid-binding Zn-ribbon protein